MKCFDVEIPTDVTLDELIKITSKHSDLRRSTSPYELSGNIALNVRSDAEYSKYDNYAEISYIFEFPKTTDQGMAKVKRIEYHDKYGVVSKV